MVLASFADEVSHKLKCCGLLSLTTEKSTLSLKKSPQFPIKKDSDKQTQRAQNKKQGKLNPREAYLRERPKRQQSKEALQIPSPTCSSHPAIFSSCFQTPSHCQNCQTTRLKQFINEYGIRYSKGNSPWIGEAKRLASQGARSPKNMGQE